MKILQTIKSKAKALMGLVLTGAVIAQMFVPISTASAAAVQFNRVVGDWELLRGANRTTNQTNWTDPVSGTAGDTFAGMVFYHNDMLDLTAHNVLIKVNMPAQTTNKTAVLSASISSDDSDTVTDTVNDGVVVGKSGLTVNLNEDAKISLVPGSVKWFPDYVSAGTPNKPLLFGQSGDEITSANGLRLGDIEGCWEHLGYVTFLFKTEKVATASVAVDKTVRNVTLGETNFVKSNFGKPSDTLEYNVVVRNTGAGAAENLVLTDTIAAGTSFILGSVVLARNGGAFGTVADGILSSDGMSLGTIPSGESVNVRFRVKINQNVTNGATLTNTVFLHFNKQQLTSTAATVVKFTVTVPGPGGGPLPVTGGENTILTFLVVLSGSLAGVYNKYRKVLSAKIW